MELVLDLETLTEEQGRVIFERIASQFGWFGAIFTREDFENVWLGATESDSEARPFDESDWEAFTKTWEYANGVTRLATEAGIEVLQAYIYDVSMKDLTGSQG